MTRERDGIRDLTGELGSYLDGELPGDARERIEASASADPALREQLDQLRRLDAALAELSPPEPSPGFETRFRARLAAERERRARPAWRRLLDRLELSHLLWGAGGLAAASAALLLAQRPPTDAAFAPERPALDLAIAAEAEPEAWELLREEDLELLEVLEILEDWDGTAEI